MSFDGSSIRTSSKIITQSIPSNPVINLDMTKIPSDLDLEYPPVPLLSNTYNVTQGNYGLGSYIASASSNISRAADVLTSADPKSLTGFTNGASVTTLGSFTQTTGSQAPIYTSSGGINNVPYITFNRTSGQHLQTPGSITLNIGTNGGFTALTLVKFNGTASAWERIFDFGSGANVQNIVLSRQNTTNQFRVFMSNAPNGTWYDLTSGSGTITQNTWQVFGLRYTTSSNLTELFLNNVRVAAGTSSITLTDRTLTTNYIGRSNWSGEDTANMDFGGLYIYDRAISDTEMSNLYEFMITSFYSSPSILNPSFAFESSNIVSNIDSFWHSKPLYNSTTGSYIGTSGTTTITGTTYNGEWLQLELPEAIRLNSFDISPRQDSITGRTPRNFVVLGSGDGLRWNLVFTGDEITLWSTLQKTFSVTSNKLWKFYRIVVTKVGISDNGSWQNSVQISRWRLYGQSNESTLPSGVMNIKTNLNADYDYYLYGPWIGDPVRVLPENIKTLSDGTKVYMIYDGSTYTKMVTEIGVAKYYSGNVNLFNPANWDTYTDVGGNYKLGKNAIKNTISQNGLIAWFDPQNPKCYPGTGGTLYNLIDGSTATLNGTYNFTAGNIRLVNTSANYLENTSNLQISTLSSITTVSIWYYENSSPTNGVLLDFRTGGAGGFIYKGQPNAGSAWTSGNLYKNGGQRQDITWSNIETIGSWQNITVTTNTPATDNMNIFSDWVGTASMDVTFGPIFVYNRVISQEENAYNFNAIRTRYNLDGGYPLYSPIGSGLIGYYDPANPLSYSGSGATLANLIGTSGSATLGGSYNYMSGNIRLNNTTSSYLTNISSVQLTTLPSIRTVSLWYYQHTPIGSQNGYLLDMRTGNTGGFIWGGGSGSAWTSGNLYKNGGDSQTITWSNIETVGSWQNITVVANTSATDDLTIFGRNNQDGLSPPGAQALNVTFGPILIYNRVITQAENLYNFNVFRKRFGLGSEIGNVERPLLYKTGGINNGPYARFDSSRRSFFEQNTTTASLIATNGGFTTNTLVKFRDNNNLPQTILDMTNLTNTQRITLGQFTNYIHPLDYTGVTNGSPFVITATNGNSLSTTLGNLAFTFDNSQVSQSLSKTITLLSNSVSTLSYGSTSSSMVTYQFNVPVTTTYNIDIQAFGSLNSIHRVLDGYSMGNSEVITNLINHANWSNSLSNSSTENLDTPCSYSIKFRGTTGTNVASYITQTIPITASVSYSANIKVFCTGTISPYAKIEWLDGTDNILSTNEFNAGNTNTSNVFKTVTFTGVAPANSVNAKLSIGVIFYDTIWVSPVSSFGPTFPSINMAFYRICPSVSLTAGTHTLVLQGSKATGFGGFIVQSTDGKYYGYSVNSKNNLSFSINNGDAVYPRVSNLVLPAKTIPSGSVLQLEPRNLTGYTTGSSVNAIGQFSQATASQAPTYTISGGFNNFPYVSFNRTASQHLQVPSLTLNMATNGGFTALTLVRFTGTAGAWERIFEFFDDTGNNILLSRVNTTQNFRIAIYNGRSNSYPLNTSSSPIIQNTWQLFACRYNTSTNFTEIFLNGVCLASGTSTQTMTNRTLTTNYIGRSSSASDAYCNMDFGGLYVYDRALTDTEMTELYLYMISTIQPQYDLTKWNNLTASYDNISGNTDIYAGNQLIKRESAISMYPPAALTANSTTVSGSIYGNGAYVASASSSHSDNENPFKAFNKNKITSTDMWTVSRNGSLYFYSTSNGSYIRDPPIITTIGATNYAGEWLQLQLPVAIQLKSYNLYTRSDAVIRGPKDFWIMGSNDGSSWVLLDTETNQTSWTSSGKSYRVNHSNYYSYFRIVINSNNNDVWVSICEWELFGLEQITNKTFSSTSIGKSVWNSTTNYSNMDLVNLRVYDKVLTGREIQNLTNVSNKTITNTISPISTVQKGTSSDSPEEISKLNKIVNLSSSICNIDVTSKIKQIEETTVSGLLEFPPSSMSTAITEFVDVPYGSGLYTSNASSTYSTSGSYFAFDKNDATFWHSSDTVYNFTTGSYSGTVTSIDVSGTSYIGEWIQIQLSTPIKLYHFTAAPRANSFTTRSPRNFNILGSNDGCSWTNIYTGTNVNDWTSSSKTFYLTPSSSNYQFRFFRFVTSRVGNSDSGAFQNSVQIAEWRLYGTPCQIESLVYPLYDMTGNTTAMTTGNYGGGSYTASASSTLSGVNPFLAFNSSSLFTGYDHFWHSNGVYNASTGAYTGSNRTGDFFSTTNYISNAYESWVDDQPNSFKSLVTTSTDGYSYNIQSTRKSDGSNQRYGLAQTIDLSSISPAGKTFFCAGLYKRNRVTGANTLELKITYRDISGNTLGTFSTYSGGVNAVDTTWKYIGLHSTAPSNTNSVVINVGTSYNEYFAIAPAFVFNESISGEWLQIQLPRLINLSKFTILPRQDSSLWNNRSPQSFTLLGSTDGNLFRVIDTETDLTWTNAAKTFTPSDLNRNFNIFRLVTRSVGNSDQNTNRDSINISRFVLYEDTAPKYVLSQPITNVGEFVQSSPQFAPKLISGLLEYPPINLTSNSTTILNSRYGNGNYIASASSILNGDFPASAAFESNTLRSGIDNFWHSASIYNTTGTGLYTGSISTTVGSTVYNGEWLQIQLPERIRLSNFKITPRQEGGLWIRRSPVDFIIAGSNDGANWDLVFSTTSMLNWEGGRTRTFFTSTNNFYNFYRMVVTRVTDNSVNISRWQLFGYANESDYISFNSSFNECLDGGNKTLNISTNDGFTANALVKFDGIPVSNEPLFDFGTLGVTSGNLFLRRSGTTGNLQFGSGTNFVTTTTNPIVNGDWNMYTVKYKRSTNLVEFYKDNSFLTSGTIGSIGNITCANTFIGRSMSNVYSNVDIKNLNLFDRSMTNSELSLLTDKFKGARDIESKRIMEYPPSGLTNYTTTFSNLSYGNGSYIASASSESISANKKVWRMFNKRCNQTEGNGSQYTSGIGRYNTNGVYIGNTITRDINNNTYSGEWIQIQFPKSINLTSFTLYPRIGIPQRSPVNFTVLGSNNGNNWVNVFSMTGQSTTDALPRNYTCQTDSSYSFYRLVIQRIGNTDGLINMEEWILYGYEDSQNIQSINGRYVRVAKDNLSINVPEISVYDNTGSLISLNKTATSSSIFNTDASYNSASFGFDGNYLSSAFKRTVSYPPAPLIADTTNISSTSSSYGSGLYIASASSLSVGSAWNVFDESTSVLTTATGGYNTTTGSYTGTFFFNDKFGKQYNGDYININLPELIYTTGLEITPNSTTWATSAPTGFTLLGSSSGGDWAPLLSTTTSWTSADTRQFLIGGTVGNNIACNSYRLSVNSIPTNNSSGVLSIQDIKILGGPIASQQKFLEFPPTSLTGTTTGITSQSYGNGTYTVTASSIYDASYDGWYAFDKTTTGVFNGWFTQDLIYTGETGEYNGSTSMTVGNVGYVGEWIQIQLPRSITLDSLRITPRVSNATTRSPRNFYIFASNDGNSWTLIYTGSNVNNWTTFSKYFVIGERTEYSYYRMLVSSVGNYPTVTSGLNGLNITEMTLYGRETTNARTNADFNAFVQMDLGQEYPISKVVLHNTINNQSDMHKSYISILNASSQETYNKTINTSQLTYNVLDLNKDDILTKTTTSYQELYSAHDNINYSFDSYYNGSWQTDVPFHTSYQISKTNNGLRLKVGSETSSTSKLQTFTDTLVISTSGSLILGDGGSSINSVLEGILTFGTGSAGINTATVNLGKTLTTLDYNVIINIETSGTETYAFTVTNKIYDSFQIKIYRTDSPGASWSSTLKINWLVLG